MIVKTKKVLKDIQLKLSFKSIYLFSFPTSSDSSYCEDVLTFLKERRLGRFIDNVSHGIAITLVNRLSPSQFGSSTWNRDDNVFFLFLVLL
jgi:hypothetical protein